VPLDYLPGTFFGPPTLVELVRHRAEHQPDSVAFTYLVDGDDEQVSLTNRELDRQAKAIAAWLETHDLVGSRALLLYPPGLEFISAFFGCLYAGVVAVPVYPPRRNRSLERIQAISDDTEAKVALTTDAVLRRIEPLIDTTPHLKELEWLTSCHVPEGMERHWQMPDIDGHTLAFLQYTSGSTGTPKGVILDHANLMHNSALISHAFEHTRSGQGVFWLPSYHDMGLIGGVVQPLYIGRPNILMSPMAFLQKPFRWLSAISRFRATTSGGPNFAYDLCVRQITAEQRQKLDLSSWEVAFSGAEPVRQETIDRFTEAFEPCGFRHEAFYPCFGLAEATLLVSGGYVAREPVIREFDSDALADGRAVPAELGNGVAKAVVGCGQTLPDQKIAIADPETGDPCEPGIVGEIWVSGPSVARGYWRQPEATEETFRATLNGTGEGPYLRTGDLGFLDDDELFVTGRIKDLIIHHGVNIYPQDIERSIQASHPALRANAGGVFTVEVDDRQRLVVVQELERRSRVEPADIFNAIRRVVSREHEMAMDAILLVKPGSVPKTSSGKIQRHACRDGYLAGSLPVLAQWPDGSVQELSATRVADAVPDFRTSPPTESPKPPDRPARLAPVCREPIGGPPRESAAPLEPVDRPLVTSVPEDSGGGNGKPPLDTAELVLQQVRKVAKDRADDLTLDTYITEIGLDSLERMEILSSLESLLGGRFPEEILPELETCRQVVEAVEEHLGKGPRGRSTGLTEIDMPEEYYRIELFPEYVKLREGLDLLESTGLDPYFNVHEGITNDRTTIDGRELINFSSYNYVGMSGDPVVVEAAQHACERYGTSVSASRLVSGEKDLHADLERAITRFVGTEDSIVFVGGHATNETVIGHLFGPGDLILHDALSHNSILQGAILSGARRRPFPHNDWRAADRLLEQYRREHRRVVVVIEGVYSMDGDIPDLPRFIEVKRHHRALLMIDEAHSMGVLGASGRGIGEHFGVRREDVEIWMGTLSKSFGSCGGYVAGSKALVEYLKYTAPGFVFSVGLSPPNAASALASFHLLEAEPERIRRLAQRSKLFLDLARQGGLNTGMSKDSPVIPVILGNSIHCLKLSKGLFDRGINVQPILHPAVEESASRLRFFITSMHTEAQIRYTVDAIVAELEKIRLDSSVQTSSRRTSSLR
jgi:8-amino-7-oxononanoate synthase